MTRGLYYLIFQVQFYICSQGSFFQKTVSLSMVIIQKQFVIIRLFLTPSNPLFASDESEPSWFEPYLELKDFQLGSARDLFCSARKKSA